MQSPVEAPVEVVEGRKTAGLGRFRMALGRSTRAAERV
jgi:hypothetical protein